jgi:hypothetical protein
MLTRREVEGELRSLGFRASARERRAEREKARRFAQCVIGALFGVVLLALLGAVNLVTNAGPPDLAFGHSSYSRGSEWVGGSTQGTTHRTLSLFFNGRRTRHPNDPRNRHRGGADF